MNNSELTLIEAVYLINNFHPVKVLFNNLVLYNDYDSEIENEDGICGEVLPLLAVVPDRIENFKNVIVTTINIGIVDFHHSIVEIYGEDNKVIDIKLHNI